MNKEEKQQALLKTVKRMQRWMNAPGRPVKKQKPAKPTKSIASRRDFHRIKITKNLKSKAHRHWDLLFLIDPVMALNELGYDLVPAVRRYLLQKFGGSLSKNSTTYEAVRKGAKIPFITRVNIVSNRKSKK